MPESTLSLTRDDLLAEIGDYLGIGRDTDAWEGDDPARVESCLKTGLRWVYFPTTAGGPVHDWRFLQVPDVINLEADQVDYDLPDDFGSLVGDLYHRTSDRAICFVPVRGEALILARRGQLSQPSGRPQLAATRPKATQGVVGQREELLIWPTPDRGYSLNYTYRILPQALDAVRQYPYGGAKHAELFKAAVIAAAEEMQDDAKGVRFQGFMQILVASIAQDAASSPDNLGYNGDRSDRRTWRSERHSETSVVTYDGFR